MCRRAFFVLPSEAMGQTSSAERAEHFSRLAAGRSHAESPDARGAVEGAWNRSPRGDQGLHARVDPDLPREDRQDPVPGSAPGARRDAAAPLAFARYLRAATFRREPPDEAAFVFLAPPLAGFLP